MQDLVDPEVARQVGLVLAGLAHLIDSQVEFGLHHHDSLAVRGLIVPTDFLLADHLILIDMDLTQAHDMAPQ